MLGFNGVSANQLTRPLENVYKRGEKEKYVKYINVAIVGKSENIMRYNQNRMAREEIKCVARPLVIVAIASREWRSVGGSGKYRPATAKIISICKRHQKPISVA